MHKPQTIYIFLLREKTHFITIHYLNTPAYTNLCWSSAIFLCQLKDTRVSEGFTFG